MDLVALAARLEGEQLLLIEKGGEA
jgi:hypothetical protein